MIIGITGTFGAGKGTVVSFLKKRGFSHYSVRDFLTEEIAKRGLELNRDSMILVANDLRAKFGASCIVDELFARAKEKGGNAVIESIRCIGEAEALKKNPDFVFWAVDADVESRYARVVERGSPSDGISFQDFVRQEALEMTSADLLKQNLRACIEMADCRFKNDWTIAELEGKIEKALDGIVRDDPNDARRYERPSWDEYFMEICRSVGRRATCDRGRAGCVVVRDKQILVTGYVGSPVGLAHCDEVGHKIEETIHEDGIKRSHCIRTAHAEQNAICQAAKLGISLDGSTVYCKMEPCSVCVKMIINSGVKRVVCEKRYQSGAQSLLREAGVLVEVLVDEVEKY